MLAALHPHDVRPQIGQKPRAERRREHVAEVENPDSGQRRRIDFHCCATPFMLDAVSPFGSKAYVAALRSVKQMIGDHVGRISEA